MNFYVVRYNDNGWVPFVIKSDSIYEALDWVHTNVQETGVCISKWEW